ncbi:MAG: molybdopterin-dependent oxidoreductase, partial [Deltaproteobacteria bacterium]|nr:molybdopterin-dependent oxidoreductase [Deltaproteobacteria bacterium]
MKTYPLSMTVNGRRRDLEVLPHETLLQVLRDHLGLKGVKEGCGSGECGACMVLVDGRPVNSCILLALECRGARVETVEGLAEEDGSLSTLQEAFVRHGAVQCGFCTPGMLMASKGFLENLPADADRQAVRKALSGNLCRCTGYKKIVDAVETVVRGGCSTSEPSGQGNIGRSFSRRDAEEHVRGLSVFGPDMERPGMVFGRILRSAYAHAAIRRIDTTEAEKLEGVVAVVTGKDVPAGYFGVDIKDRLVFAREKARYVGDEIAAVAALSEEIAARALDLIRVEYEPLESVLDPLEAMKEGAPLVHEDLEHYECSFETEKRGNICTVARVEVGDLEKGFAQSDIVLEDVFSTQIQHQSSIEPHAALAEVDCHGKIHVWTTTQKPFAIRRYLSQSLQIPMTSIRVVATKIGGGFGGKLEMIVEPYAVVLALKCRRPVKIVYSREEEFLATTPRHQTRFWVKSGIKKDGTLVARHVRFIYDTGAYSGNGPTTVTLSTQLSGGLYRVPNLLIEGYCVYTNKMNCGSMRGPSAPQTSFALESHTDNLARAAGMDPLDFRLKNLLREGEKTGVGQTLVDVDYRRVVESAAEAIGWRRIPKEDRVGKGMACVFWLSGGWATSATVKINEDGTVTLTTGAVDMGTGYLYTSVPQIVAEELGIRSEDVEIVQGGTDQATYDHGIGGSRGTFTIGMVARKAAANAREELFREAAVRLGVKVDSLETRGGWIFLREDPEKRVSFAEISYDRHIKAGGPIIGWARYLPEMDAIEPDRVRGLSFTAFKGNTIGCHAAVVRVHPETGHLDVLRYVAAHDVGRAINPRAVEGQIEGGVSMGLGFALTESVQISGKGEVLNPNFHDYRLPTSMDVPEVEPVIVEVPAAHGPYGSKGLGEPTMAPVAAAIGNAVYDAVGVRL